MSGERGKQGEQGDTGERGPQGRRGARGFDKRENSWIDYVPVATTILMVVIVFGVVGIATTERKHDLARQAQIAATVERLDNLAHQNKRLIDKNEAARKQSFKRGCRYQNVITAVLLWGFETREEMGITTASDTIGIRNCAASFAESRNVFLNESDTAYVIQIVTEKQQLPIFDADGKLKKFLSLPALEPIKADGQPVED